MRIMSLFKVREFHRRKKSELSKFKLDQRGKNRRLEMVHTSKIDQLLLHFLTQRLEFSFCLAESIYFPLSKMSVSFFFSFAINFSPAVLVLVDLGLLKISDF